MQGAGAALVVATSVPPLWFLVLGEADRIAGMNAAIFAAYAILGAAAALCAIPLLFTSHRAPAWLRHTAVTILSLSAAGFVALGALAAFREPAGVTAAIAFEFAIFGCASALLAYRLQTSSRAVEVPGPSPEQKQTQLRERFTELRSRRNPGS
ncbi:MULTISPECIES: hypothetical protein [Nocardia]|uniref:hypothetical protein n=1 Tax=Nocardia TaxID=1817 RepID=UPI000FDBB1B2|nr:MULTISPECIES: hypothetical protein [Nocardia]MBF6184312.1 hypothetical protein [Nocardia farcinica]MBF6310156.1 hypothetical protein [Nocardia farcinica]MBF6406024.1 hypothetical protein [Nocardia farcinica]UEX25226.1 hypothetical protein LMJ57_12500 [Nocardia farcinica]